MANTTNVQRAIAIPEPTNELSSLWRTTQALKEAVEVSQGIRGNREVALKADLENLSSGVTNIVSNTGTDVTHTGEVTGAAVLTLDVTSVTNRVNVVADAVDDVAIHDSTDGTLKKVNLSSITDAGFF